MKILELLEDDRGFGGDFGSPEGGMDGAEGGPSGGMGGFGGESQAPSGNANLKFSDLSSLQIAMLKRVSSGAVDVDSASENTLNSLDELKDLGLLDDAYELTDGGNKAVRIAAKVGGGNENTGPSKMGGESDFDMSDGATDFDMGRDDSSDAEFGDDSDEFNFDSDADDYSFDDDSDGDSSPMRKNRSW